MAGEASRTVRVSKIAAAALKPPTAAPRDALAQAALSFGGARRVAVLHSKRCALIELSSTEAAAQMVRHHASSPLMLGGRAAVVTVESGGWAWPQWDEGRSLALTDDGRVAKECAAWLEVVLAELEARERAAYAARRRRERACHLAELSAVFSNQRFDRRACWRFHRHPAGGCDYSTCMRSHGAPTPRFCCCPPSLRLSFIPRDTFPACHREARYPYP